MTSEIAILNREGVALAADSAVTLGHGQKTWQTANKIFALSKYHPVGIMIYGNASFIGVPWETIVKEYRRELGKTSFSTVNDYVDDLLSFLKKADSLFPDETKISYYWSVVMSYFQYIMENVKKEVSRLLEDDIATAKTGEGMKRSEFLKLVRKTIGEHYQGWQRSEFYEGCTSKDIEKTGRKYRGQIDEAIEEVFEKLPLTEEETIQLKYIGASIFYKKYASNIGMTSGVVVAGFGDDEIFPSCKLVEICGIIHNKIPCTLTKEAKISQSNKSSVIPFAQREMVDTFMTGVDPGYQDVIDSVLSKLVEKMPELFVELVPSLSAKEKQSIRKKMKKRADSVLMKLGKELKSYRMNNFVGAITSVVADLPKTEVAQMAEALVSLTSLKRKVSMQVESVSGPIDVAVISKGDGFIWIKRKHYFKPELNPHFFQNYMRDL